MFESSWSWSIKLETSEAKNMEDITCSRSFAHEKFSDQFLRSLEQLWKQGILCDLKIICGKEKIMVHKIVLAAASNYFNAMFTSGMTETELKEIELKYLDCQSVKILINYAYTGMITMQSDSVQSLLEASDLLQFKTVRDYCCEFIINNIDLSNCLAIYQLADRYSCDLLKRESQGFFNRNFEKIVSSIHFMNLNLSSVKRFLQDDHIHVQGEDSVLDALIQWTQYDYENRQCYWTEGLKCLRIQFISPLHLKNQAKKFHELKNFTKKDFLLRKNQSNKFYINEVRMRHNYEQWLYVFGGEKSFLTEISDIEFFNHSKEEWQPCKPLKSARSSFAAVVIEDKLFVIGGMRRSVKLCSTKCYDSKTQKWTTLPPPLKCRGDVKAAVIEGILYCAGGSGERRSACRYLEKYDPTERKWTRLENMNNRRRRFSLVALNGFLYALGGFDDSYGDLNTVEHYNPKFDCWVKDAPMITKRTDFGAVALSEFIYAVGGANGTRGSMDLVEKFNPYENSWSPCASMANCRGGLSVAVFFGRIVAFSGMNIYMSLIESAEYYNEAEDKWLPFPSLQIARFGSVALCLPFQMPLSEQTGLHL